MMSPASSASAAIVKVKTWGEGPGPGQLYLSEGIATDDDDHVYVADTGHQRIAEFSPGGRYLDQWGDTGPQDEQLSAPFDLDFDSAGNAYVSDPSLASVYEFDAAGGFLRHWGRPGTGNGEFGHDQFDNAPYGIAVGIRDRVYASDYPNLRVQEFTSTGTFLHKWGSTLPRYIATDPDGNLYVAEYYSSRIVKYSPTGRFLLTFGYGVRNGDAKPQVCRPPEGQCGDGVPGNRPGQFNLPEGIATDSAGNVYVADNGTAKFSPSGHYLTTIPQGGNDVAVDSKDNVYVLYGRIVKFAQIPPKTMITRSKVRGHRARFRFTSSEEDSNFRCKLDRRPFRRCDSPRAYRHLDPGRHRFEVKAIDSDKLTDASPARKSFRIRL